MIGPKRGVTARVVGRGGGAATTRTGFAVLVLVLIAAAALGAVLPSRAAAASSPDLSLNDLVEKAAELDGQQVTVTGEAIGDLLRREGYGWVNINDGTNAFGVRASLDALSVIDHLGRFGQRGDLLRVSGTFYRADPAAGGDPAIRAQAIEIVQEGGPVPEPVPAGRVAAAIVSLVAAALLGGLWWVRRSRGLA